MRPKKPAGGGRNSLAHCQQLLHNFSPSARQPAAQMALHAAENAVINQGKIVGT